MFDLKCLEVGEQRRADREDLLDPR